MSRTREQQRYDRGIRAADDFNARYPVGTPVTYWPGLREGTGRESVTRSAAWSTLSGHAVVCVEGYAGGIALTHVAPSPSSPTEPEQEGT